VVKRVPKKSIGESCTTGYEEDEKGGKRGLERMFEEL
jgi:hypothetical protein